MTAYNQIASNKRRTIILIALFVIVIIALGYVFSQAMDYGWGGVILATILSVVMSLVSYYSGDKLALLTAGAKGPIKKEENAYAYRLVENLAITAGLPMPKVYIIPDSAINAFATGRDPKHASIAITQGAIANLENEELEGVVAHELAHIKNYDIRLMMIVIICVSITTLLANWFFRFSFFGGRRSSNRNGGGAGIILLLIGIVLAILSPVAAKLIQLAISRKREFMADASGVLLTRYPEGLAKALEKINQQDLPLMRANKATAHLYISNPFAHKKGFFSKMFSTHPPIEERVKALRSIA
ncbi:MAG: M48 family metallopeptidase [Patescibacteria group bacterium]|jgi:heat shock protein HtpX